MKHYKIRNSEGLFSTGGYTPKWHKTGKTWKQIGHIKNHIHLLTDEDWRGVSNPKIIYKDCVLEVTEFKEAEIREESIEQVL